jgi:hypothetical protein
VRLDLLDRLHVDQRTDHRSRLEPVGDLHRAVGLGEALGEGVIDAVLHQDAVGADAGLAGIPTFRGDRALDRHLSLSRPFSRSLRVALPFTERLKRIAGTSNASRRGLPQHFATVGPTPRLQREEDS